MKTNNDYHLRRVIALFAFACFALPSQARAACQQGCDGTTRSTFLGENALLNNAGGGENTAVGFDTLVFNTTGYGNTASGSSALKSNTSGNYNTANGRGALFFNTTGFYNAATGVSALAGNTEGSSNTADGVGALAYNTTGNNNTATGFQAMLNTRSGDNNTASGVLALSGNTYGGSNTAAGHNALSSNTTGSFNIALGAEAGRNLTTGNNNIDIANRGVAGEADTIRIGTGEKHTNTFIAGISGATVPGGVPVIVDASGHLGTIVSSQRFKDEIKPMNKMSEAILALKPVTFRYKKEFDPQGIPQFGLVAEEVAKVSPDLVARDAKGNVYTVRHDAVNAMLLNEFLKEHRKNEKQEAMIAELRQQIAALTAGLQKVSAQLEVGKAASQTVVNNQ